MDGQQSMYERELVAQERALQSHLRRFFERQNAELLAALSRGTKALGDWFDALKARAPDLSDKELLELAKELLGDLIDWDAQRVNLERIILPAQLAGFDAGIRTTQAAYGIPAIQAPDIAKEYLELGMRRIGKMNDTTRAELARSIIQGMKEGDGRAGIIERVREHMPDVSDRRAVVIATTEEHTAITCGSMAQMKSAGFRWKRWRAVMDGATRPSHRAMHGKRAPIDGYFDNGLRFPGDPSGEPREIMNCRCVLLAVEEGG